MFLSAVTITSKPASSATCNSSPFVNVSQFLSFALMTVWLGRNRAIPIGVTWSNRMSIDRRTVGCDRRRVQTPCRKLKHRVDLFPRYVELFNDVFDACSRFEVFENGGHGHPGVAKDPCAAQPARYAFHGGTFGPIESGHTIRPFRATFNTGQVVRATTAYDPNVLNTC